MHAGSIAIVFCEPLAGWRELTVTERRTKLDWAEQVRVLLDGRYAAATKVVLVMDNLNTHRIGSLYEAFPSPEARCLVERLEIHYTPKHGSWLNISASELAAFTTQCLNGRRLGSPTRLKREAPAWESARNAAAVMINWTFTINAARHKLHRTYPRIQA